MDLPRIGSSIHAKAKKPIPSADGASASAATSGFTTYERIDEIPYMVVKKDGRHERFDRQKILNGLMQACQKRQRLRRPDAGHC